MCKIRERYQKGLGNRYRNLNYNQRCRVLNSCSIWLTCWPRGDCDYCTKGIEFRLPIKMNTSSYVKNVIVCSVTRCDFSVIHCRIIKQFLVFRKMYVYIRSGYHSAQSTYFGIKIRCVICQVIVIAFPTLFY